MSSIRLYVAVLRNVTCLSSCPFRQGVVSWSSTSQSQAVQWLCAGYIVVEGNGQLKIDLQNAAKSAIIYTKNNGARHSSLGTRVLGGLHTDESKPVRV